MEQYRTKPVVIDAIRTPLRHEEPSDALVDLVQEQGWEGDSEGIIITTMEGNLLALPGDWIIRGVKGEYYPCKHEIFEATYDKV